ncbi:MAG: hypothetical protein MJ089_07740 [Ruminococcus sp.]|nr:hypothetical protein [Ruminococcus sp.]
MKKFRRITSAALATMMAFSGMAALSTFGSSAATTNKITLSSNLTSNQTFTYTPGSSTTFTATYYLKSSYKVVDVQAKATYDSAVLKPASTVTKTNMAPVFSVDGNYMGNKTSTGTLAFNSTNLDSLYNFSSEGVFFTATFDIVGSGDTKVNLDVDIITATTAKSGSELANAEDVQLVYYDQADTSKFSFRAVGEVKGGVTPPTPATGANVIGDINLKLNPSGTNKAIGVIALQKGTYKFKIAIDGKEYGYSKTITDKSTGLSFKSTYTSSVTLNATGGTYTFQLNTATAQLVINYSNNLPKQYLIGDLNVILNPVQGKNAAVGTTYLEAGTYNFKLSINAVPFGYGKTVTDTTAGSSLSFSNKYASSVKLIATGGNYTFNLNTATNKLQISYAPVKDENLTDVHVSGDFDLVLDDNDGNDNIAVGTVKLAEGVYGFKIYNYGTAYTAGVRIANEGTKALKSSYTTSATLIANGGTYTFSFNKTTGELTVKAA